jgi:hypothetical protein
MHLFINPAPPAEADKQGLACIKRVKLEDIYS